MFEGVITRLIVSLLMLVGSTAFSACLFYRAQYLFGVLFALVAIAMVASIFHLFRYNTRKITFMFNAVENDDFTFQFTEYKGAKFNNLFNMALNRIKGLLAKTKLEAVEREKYYELILRNVVTGVVVLNDKGSVMQTNAKALKLLGLPVFTHVSQLGRVYEPLSGVFLSLESGESTTVSFHNELGTVSLSLLASEVVIRGERLKIVAINDIDRELDEKEVESWIRLTRVLTHEIMNTITPVTSLSETLLNMHQSKDDDFYRGLEAINATSKGLISFVESYRSFTRIPPPKIEQLSMRRFLERMEVLAREDAKSSSLLISVDVRPGDLVFYADEKLISQVVLNLLKNAVAAIGDRPVGRIRVTAAQDDAGHVTIAVANNGDPIPPEVAEHIFVPFFTTKETGSGIGLSISRQIMRLHNGSIKLKSSNETETCFVLLFR